MPDIRFEWDEAKNRFNRRKHGIAFEEGSRVFCDPLHLSVQNRIENGEQRWRTFGCVDGVGVVVVAHATGKVEGVGGWVEVVRIISARRAARSERRRYENENG